MKIAAFCLIASLALGDSALAGTKPNDQVPAEHCLTIAQIKAVPSMKGAKFFPLNIGQFNYVLGAFDATTPPNTPPPSADNAVLVRMHDKGLIIWMKKECSSFTEPMPLSSEMAGHVMAIKPTAGEDSDAIDDSQDLHL